MVLKRLLIAGLVSLLATVQSVAAQGPSVVGLWQKIDEQTGKAVVWFLFIERGVLPEGLRHDHRLLIEQFGWRSAPYAPS